MRRVICLVFIAAFAGSTFAASASAEETLLAEWLDSGVAITALLSTVSEEPILFADEGFGSVNCEAVFDGSVGPNGEDETTEVLTLSGVAVTLSSELVCKNDAGSLCENSMTDILVAPEKLPWHTELLLNEAGDFEDMVAEAAYSVTCLIFGFATTDDCAVSNVGFAVQDITAGVEAVGQVAPNGSCSVGGAGKGTEEFLSPNITQLLSGTLEVSSVS